MAILEKTWQCDTNRFQNPLNNTPDSCTRVLWYLKAFLKGEVGGATSGLWTCAGSSDSATAGMDATDRWTGTYDATKLINAAPGTDHSWMVLQHPTLGWQVCIDYTGAQYQLSFVYSLAGFTGGSITNRPTATDEVQNASWVNLEFHSNSSDHRMNGALATDGSFIFAGVPIGSGGAFFGWIFQILANTKSGDTFPANMYVKWAAGAGGAFNRSAMAVGTAGWSTQNANVTSIINATPLAGECGGFWPLENMSVDQQCGLFTDLPMFCGAVNSGQGTLKGRLVDIRWGPSPLSSTYAEPTLLNPTSVLLGDCWLPFSKAINL